MLSLAIWSEVMPADARMLSVAFIRSLKLSTDRAMIAEKLRSLRALPRWVTFWSNLISLSVISVRAAAPSWPNFFVWPAVAWRVLLNCVVSVSSLPISADSPFTAANAAAASTWNRIKTSSGSTT